MIGLDDTLDGTFPFRPHVTAAPGFAMHYVDEGEGRPLLCLHGEPSWSYLYRLMIPMLASRHRVVVPDMKGFGKSETPADGQYQPHHQAAALGALVEALDLEDITLVLHDWGGPIGSAMALAHLDRIRALVLLNTVTRLGLPIEAELLRRNAEEARYFRWMASLHARGILDTVLGEFGTIIPTVMRDLQGVFAPHVASETWALAYSAPFATPAECAAAIELPRTIVSRQPPPPVDPQAAAALAQLPAMMIYGMKDRVLLPQHFIPIFEAQFPQAPVYRLPDAGHFLQEDEPHAIANLILQFTRALPSAGSAHR